MTVEDITHLLDKEEGTAFDQQTAMFADFDEGGIFAYDAARIWDIDQMLERDGKARTLQEVLTLPLRSATRSIQRDRATKQVHDFVTRVLMEPEHNGGMSTPIDQIIAQMAQAVVYRKSYHEKVWTVKEDRYCYDKLAWRPPSTCNVVRDKRSGAFQGFRQVPIMWDQNDSNEIRIKPVKSFVYIHGQHRNPMEGASDLDIAYWCYKTKQKIRFLWYSFLEGQSLPKTIVRDDTEAAAKKAAQKLLGLRQGGIVGLGRGTEVQAYESTGRGAGQFQEALRWLDSEASGSVLAGFTDLGAQAASGTGSFALSKDQTDFFLMSRQTVAREMEATLNHFLVAPLVRYNFGNVAMPKFEFGPIAEDDAGKAVTLLQAIATVPDSSVPREFLAELVEQVAAYLGLNTQTVRDGLMRIAKEAEEKAANAPTPPPPGLPGTVAAVGAATRAVQDAQIQNAPEPPTPTPTGAGSPRPATGPRAIA